MIKLTKANLFRALENMAVKYAIVAIALLVGCLGKFIILPSVWNNYNTFISFYPSKISPVTAECNGRKNWALRVKTWTHNLGRNFYQTFRSPNHRREIIQLYYFYRNLRLHFWDLNSHPYRGVSFDSPWTIFAATIIGNCHTNIVVLLLYFSLSLGLHWYKT